MTQQNMQSSNSADNNEHNLLAIQSLPEAEGREELAKVLAQKGISTADAKEILAAAAVSAATRLGIVFEETE